MVPQPGTQPDLGHIGRYFVTWATLQFLSDAGRDESQMNSCESLKIIHEKDKFVRGPAHGWKLDPSDPTSPKFTGSHWLKGKNRSLLRELSNLPGGLHFSVESRVENDDSRAVVDLFSRCFDTLENLHFEYHWFGTFHLDSAADKLLIARCLRTQAGLRRHLCRTSPTPRSSNM